MPVNLVPGKVNRLSKKKYIKGFTMNNIKNSAIQIGFSKSSICANGETKYEYTPVNLVLCKFNRLSKNIFLWVQYKMHISMKNWFLRPRLSTCKNTLGQGQHG